MLLKTGGARNQDFICIQVEAQADLVEPIAAEPSIRIVLKLFGNAGFELRVGCEQLLFCGISMIRQIIGAAHRKSNLDQRTQRLFAAQDGNLIVIDVQIENDAGEVVSGPGKKSLVVLFDHAHSAVNDVRTLAHQSPLCCFEKSVQPGFRDIELGDHL